MALPTPVLSAMPDWLCAAPLPPRAFYRRSRRGSATALHTPACSSTALCRRSRSQGGQRVAGTV
ncbi:hypothetical protein BS78_05G095000 [Paspalum vaginatum]|nr:hypothetical protein BS78_05G095000 [Paspalum vaginatum]